MLKMYIANKKRIWPDTTYGIGQAICLCERNTMCLLINGVVRCANCGTSVTVSDAENHYRITALLPKLLA